MSPEELFQDALPRAAAAAGLQLATTPVEQLVADAPAAKTLVLLDESDPAAIRKDIHLTVSNSTGANVRAVVQATRTGDLARRAALYALEYGGAYVAVASLPELDAVLAEAVEFDGPAVIALDATESRADRYRFTPGGEFRSYSTEVAEQVRKFLDREHMLSLKVKLQPGVVQSWAAESNALASGLAEAEGGEAAAGDGAKAATVLYASDTGHAEECARKLARAMKAAGWSVKCAAMDAIGGAAALSGRVFFFIATAGQGECPGNGLALFKELSSGAPALGQVQYAVFALGDSKYWPEPEHFARAGRELDAALEKCGATRTRELGLGDDQDADQYRTGYNAWFKELAQQLGFSPTAAAGGGEDAPQKTDEVCKIEGVQLRGTLKASLDDGSTGQVPFHDTKMIKFHGSYQQDNRELREERKGLGLEPAFSYMIRVRLPGGFCSMSQWLQMDDICEKYANGTLKITTRQTWQLHGILKKDVKDTMRAMSRACMDTIAACGDVCRNVMCCSDPSVTSPAIFEQTLNAAYAIHDHCLPRTSAWHEIFIMQGEQQREKVQVAGSTPLEEEPLYGQTYLPRKFKVAVAIPPSNDVDVFAHDCGFIAIIEQGELKGFNVTVGGGLGHTHNVQKTFPRLADTLGFCTVAEAKYVCEAVMLTQRDFGDRTDRKHARIKYTIEDYGVTWFKEQVEQRWGQQFQPERAYKLERKGDRIGWYEQEDGSWSVGIHIPAGRVKGHVRQGVRRACEALQRTDAVVRMTCNQGMYLQNVPAVMKPQVSKIFDKFGVPHLEEYTSGMRRNMMACVAMPTCPLAMADAETYLPTLVDKMEDLLERVGLSQEAISIRMTGCPNSCGRPELAEIGFIGRAPGYYNMYLGADRAGHRMNTLYKEQVNEADILRLLQPMLEGYAKKGQPDEGFGDYCVRTGIVKAMTAGRLWWDLGNFM